MKGPNYKTGFEVLCKVKSTMLKLEMSISHLGKDGLKLCTENDIPSMFKLAAQNSFMLKGTE